MVGSERFELPSAVCLIIGNLISPNDFGDRHPTWLDYENGLISQIPIIASTG